MSSPLDGNGVDDATCERCQGNGEIVTDWERYRHPRDGDVGDEAVASCPDCDGTGALAPSQTAVEPVALAQALKNLTEGAEQEDREILYAAASTLTAQAAALVAAERRATHKAEVAAINADEAAHNLKRALAAEKQQGAWFKAWRVIIDGVIGPRPMCRDCADEAGTCPTRDGLPCDPSEEVVERFRRLTARAEAAEKRIAELEAGLEPFAEGNVDVSGTAVIVGYPLAQAAVDRARRLTHQEKNNG